MCVLFFTVALHGQIWIHYTKNVQSEKSAKKKKKKKEGNEAIKYHLFFFRFFTICTYLIDISIFCHCHYFIVIICHTIFKTFPIQTNKQTHIYAYTCIHTNAYTYARIYIYLHMCVFPDLFTEGWII